MELLEPPYSSIQKLLKEVLFITTSFIPMHERLSSVANLLNIDIDQYVCTTGLNSQDIFYNRVTPATLAIEKSLKKDLVNSKRTLKQFCDNMIASWMIEDAVKQYFENEGRTVFLNGTDREREILVSTKVKSTPDLYISAPGKDLPICYLEIANSYSNHCKTENNLDLRYNKLDNLKNKSKKIPTGIVLIDIYAAEMILINIAPNTPHDDVFAFFGNVPSKRISLLNSRRIPLSDLVAHKLQFA